MLLIIEVILTVVAWQKGWEWKAMMPTFISILLGIGIGACGGSMRTNPEIIFIDIIAVIILVIMANTKPKKNTELLK